MPFCAEHVHMVQWREGETLAFSQVHDHVVHFDVQFSVPHPNELIEALSALQRPVLVQARRQGEETVHTRVEFEVHVFGFALDG